jgi:hypothetical protein
MKEKFCILIMNVSQEKVNVHVAVDEDLNLKIVSSEEEALSFLAYEYTKNYKLFGLVPNPEKEFKKLKKRELQ